MNNALYLFVGKSASGKSTVANIFEGIGKYKSIQSYTTRPPRYDGETGHTFVSDEEFDALENIIAYTEYNNHRYCATSDQLDMASIYVVDVPGVETLLERYQTDRQIVVIYFDASIRTRIDRMIDRHDSDTAIVSRIYNDEEFDWQNELGKVVWHYKNNCGKNVEMHTVDANQNIENVLMQLTDYINYETGDKVNDDCM